MPKLQNEVEATWPQHQQFIISLLKGIEGVDTWDIVFMPRKPQRGMGALLPFGARWFGIHLVYGRRTEMLITLYHEIIHVLYPETRGLSKLLNRNHWQKAEKWVEGMAQRWWATGISPIKGADYGTNRIPEALPYSASSARSKQS